MFGTILNSIAIIAGSLIGYFFKHLIPERYSDTIMKAISLAIIVIGLQMSLKTQNIILLMCSMVLGTMIGEFVNIELKLEKLGEYLQNKIGKGENNLSQGFVTASLMYCVGSMSILGAIEGGLLGQHNILIAKSVLDFIVSIALTASLGIGVIFSSIAVFLYEGTIVLLSGVLKNLLTDVVIAEMSAVGGLLILGLGLNVILKERLKVGNMLPSLFVPLLYFLFLGLI